MAHAGFSFSQTAEFSELYVRLRAHVQMGQPNYQPEKQVLEIFALYKGEYDITQIACSFYFSDDEALRRTVRLKFGKKELEQRFIEVLASDPNVDFAEPVPQNRFFYRPNDLGPNNSTDSNQWYLHKIRAEQAWDLGKGKSGVVVAVVDDAVQTDHPELEGVCLPGRDVAQNTNYVEPPDDNYDHGTHIAGIIAANTDNGTGIASLAHGVKILPVKITMIGQPDVPTAGYEGVDWAIMNGAHVINMSWGSEQVSQTARTVINKGVNRGIVMVAAAGNSGNSSVNYPAGYPGVISVASVSNIDVRAPSSNYGSWIDVSAPGVGIRSLFPFNKYSIKTGTSFASPLVASLAALMLSVDSTLSPLQIEDCIKASSDNIDVFNPAIAGQMGAGRINAEKALSCVLAGNAPFDASIVAVLSPSLSDCRQEIDPQIRIRNKGLDTIRTLTITYQLDSGFPRSYNWSGILEPGQTDIVTFPPISAAPGNHVLRFTILPEINGTESDAFSGNNVKSHLFMVLSPLGQTLPFTEDFETSNFASKGWTVENPDSEFSWEIVSTGGQTPGSTSARLPYYLDFMTGERDYLISPTLNFSAYSSIVMTYRHAYMQRTEGLTDSLIVSISTDCGSTWTRLRTMSETGSRTFATLPNSDMFFKPSLSNEWCGRPQYAPCTSINLNAYRGMSGVRIRFEGVNRNGNNIYLDNISITGTTSAVKPVANFTAAGANSVCQGSSVAFTNLSLNRPTTYTWYMPGAVPDTSFEFQPVVVYPDTGTFPVKLVVRNNAGRDSVEKIDFIRVLPLPDLIVTANPDSVCRGDSALLIASGGIAYQWAASATLNALNKDTVIGSPSVNSTYQVTTLSDLGCTNTAQITVGVYSNPPTPIISGNGVYMISSEAVAYQWYRNGVLLVDSTGQTIWPSQSGNYNVQITDQNGCKAFSAPYFFSGVGIEDVINKVSIYPNPANEFLIIENSGELKNVKLISIAGQIVKDEGNFENGTHYLSTEGLSNGIYLLHFTVKGYPHSKRISIIR